MATRYALESDDILVEIFRHFRTSYHWDPSPWRHPRRGGSVYHDLARAARVNKMFSAHALNALWWEIPSERVALNVLPAFRATPARVQYPTDFDVSADMQNNTEWVYSINSDLIPHELERLRTYAYRVREVSIDGEERENIRIPVIEYIAGRLGGPLFPRLMCLKWNGATIYKNTGNIDRVLLAMAGTNLRILALRPSRFLSEVEDDEFHRQLLNIAPALTTRSPCIQHIELSESPDVCFVRDSDWGFSTIGVGWDSAFATPFISAFRNLERLRIQTFALDETLVDTLVALPNLLDLSLKTVWSSNSPQFQGVRGRFSKLHTMRVTVKFGEAASLLQRCEWPALQVLHVRIFTLKDCIRLDQMLEFVELIATKFRASPLHDLVLSGFYCGSFKSDTMSVTRILSPLCCLHLLRSLKLGMGSRTSYTGLYGIFLHWPALEELTLDMEELIVTVSMEESTFRGFLPHESLQTLLEVASACPRLRTVTLNCLAPPSVPLHDLDLHGLSSHNLERVTFTHTGRDYPSESIGPLATMLESVFPKLELNDLSSAALKQPSPEMREKKHMWLALLEEMRRIRREKTNASNS
ncbi:uncharacterized protein FIBRA_02597 [Fibroporia radiculosa]|uniref:F-box domain-containing protein n=1 Tax=Fibroporia radiculosa TaxID=599839 RepID=J4G1Z0_9APHY|nr:uncharacterized protein FIBRA_02597 [Fibroporia radiculosa]CCM00563.1 predicted protein [Fibroporia radiculosa]